MRRPGTPLAPEDVARLHMGIPANPMVITAALLLEGPLGHEALQALVTERLLVHPRFRQRVAEPRFGLAVPRWVDDVAFDLRRHLPAVRLGAGRSLEALVGELVSTPLDRQRPLWQLTHVEGPEGDVLVFRVQHCVADGLGLVAVLAGMADGAAPARLAEAPRRIGRRVSVVGRARRLVKGLSTAGRLAVTQAEPRSRLRGRVGIRKELAASGPLALEGLLEAARRAQTTLNGLLLAAVTEALRKQLRWRGDRDDVPIHALVPMGLPRSPDPTAGNRYASVFVPLPMGQGTPEARLKRLHEDLVQIRARGAVSRGSHLANAAGATPALVERVGVRLFSRRATVMVSSVRGPAATLALGGVGVRDVLVWAPAPGSIPLAITLFSYAGRVRIGVMADANVLGEPASIAADLERALVRQREDA